MKGIDCCKKILDSSLLTFCLIISIWQVIKGFHKYFSYPQGTSLTLDRVSETLLPDITICPAGTYDTSETTNLSKSCGLDILNHVWSTKSCPDPEANYNTLIDVPKELINMMYYMNGTCHPTACFRIKSFRLFPKNKPKLIHHAKGYRCYTFSLPVSVNETGISKVMMSYKKDAYVKVHTPGMFLVELNYLTVTFGTYIQGDLNYEIIKQLSTSENPCNDDPDYSKDDCASNEIHKVIHIRKVLVFRLCLSIFVYF